MLDERAKRRRYRMRWRMPPWDELLSSRMETCHMMRSNMNEDTLGSRNVFAVHLTCFGKMLTSGKLWGWTHFWMICPTNIGRKMTRPICLATRR